MYQLLLILIPSQAKIFTLPCNRSVKQVKSTAGTQVIKNTVSVINNQHRRFLGCNVLTNHLGIPKLRCKVPVIDFGSFLTFSMFHLTSSLLYHVFVRKVKSQNQKYMYLC